jgi:hypothetical protein
MNSENTCYKRKERTQKIYLLNGIGDGKIGQVIANDEFYILKIIHSFLTRVCALE